MFEWVIFVVLGIALILVFMTLFKQPTLQPLNSGGAFPSSKLNIKNTSQVTFTAISLSDSLGNDYNMTGVSIAPNQSVTVNLPSIPNNGSLQFYATAGADTLNVYLLNNNGISVVIPVGGSDASMIQFSASSGISTISYILTYDDNPTYKVDGTVLQNGAPFPKVLFIRNNSNSMVLTNSNNTNGTDPTLDIIPVTAFSISDSEQNPYVDLDVTKPLPTGVKAKSTIDITSQPVVLSLDNPIDNGQNLQIYIENSQSSYTIVLYNNNGKVVIIYPSDLDPTAFTIRTNKGDVKEPILEGVKEPCRNLSVKLPEEKHTSYTAVFNKPTLWRADQMDPPMTTLAIGTLRVGFVDGDPWQWAWIALKINESFGIAQYAAIDFNFVFPIAQTPGSVVPAPAVTTPGPWAAKYPIDPTHHIRISFDPNGGAWSNVGNQSTYNPRNVPSMNYGWMDAPLNTTFVYNNVTYTTPASFNQGGYTQGLGTTIVHEFGHAMGMEHEHQNPNGVPWNWDSAKLKAYFGGPPNNWTTEDINVQILNKLNSDTMNGSTFDMNSIMRYAMPASCIVNAANYPGVDQPSLRLSNCDKHWLKLNYPGRNEYTFCTPGATPPPGGGDIVGPAYDPSSPGPAPIIISNEAPVDCAVSSWSSWGSCSSQCGGGVQTQTRTITTQPVGTGALCPALVNFQTCNATACPYTLISYQPFALRQQWYANYGYCGETSFIASAMFYGMYMSQYDVRAYTSLSRTQSTEKDQVLLGEASELAAANLFKLNYERWSDTSITPKYTDNFLRWVNGHLTSNHPVISAVYEYAGLVSIPGGQPIYDHIITMTNVSLDASGNPTSVSFSDYGIITPGVGERVYNKTQSTPYLFTYDYPACRRNRVNATASSSEYSIVDASATTKIKNYGLALTGVNTTEANLVRIQLTSNVSNFETNPMAEKSETRPAPNSINLVIHLYNLQANSTYNLYRFKDPFLLPISNFNQFYNANSTNTNVVLDQIITTGPNPPMDTQLNRTIQSNEIALYRCVPSTAN